MPLAAVSRAWLSTQHKVRCKFCQHQPAPRLAHRQTAWSVVCAHTIHHMVYNRCAPCGVLLNCKVMLQQLSVVSCCLDPCVHACAPSSSWLPVGHGATNALVSHAQWLSLQYRLTPTHGERPRLVSEQFAELTRQIFRQDAGVRSIGVQNRMQS